MRLFKYRGGEFQRDLKSLEENYFWAPVRKNLNDPCEGLFDQEIIFEQLNLMNQLLNGKSSGQINQSFNNLKDSIQTLFDFADKSGIYSLSQSPLEELLWAHYAANHTGFCIEYDLHELIKYEENDYKKIDIQYKESPLAVSIEDITHHHNETILQKMFGIKSKAWKYESETRVVTSASGAHAYDYRAVKAIYFGLRMKENEKQTLMTTLKGRGVRYFQVILKNNSYTFDVSETVDSYIDAPKYKYSIAPIGLNAITPEYVSEKYKPYIDYLYKAAEIVRREPDCNEVEMVEFSASKSTDQNPVIFVQYLRKENRWVNHYLTLKEIDEQYQLINDIAVNSVSA